MIDFSITEEQQGYVKWARDFMDTHVRPAVGAIDKIQDPNERFPWAIYEAAHREGILRFGLPEKYGGAVVDEMTRCLLMEEFGAADPGVGSIIGQYWYCTTVIDQMGNDFHRENFIRRHLDNPRIVYAFALTEPTAGVDAQLPYDAPGAGPMLEAVVDGDEVVLNGVKHYQSSGQLADVIIVFARTDRTVGHSQGMTAFIVEKGTPGFTVTRTFDVMGHRTAPIGELHFDDCRIPKENQLTAWNDAFPALGRMTLGQNFTGPRDLGVARTAFEMALNYAKTRVQGGKPIIEHQMVARQLGEMAMTIETARNMIWKAAWATDNPGAADPLVIRMARVLGAEAAMKVTLDAVRIFGGPGTFTHVGVEKLLRDAVAGLHPAPTDVQLMVIGNVYGGLHQGPVAPVNVRG